MMSPNHAPIKAALATALAGIALAACSSTIDVDSPDALQDRARVAMAAGDHLRLAAMCSPATRALGTAQMLSLKAFDPDGALLKAAADEPVPAITSATDKTVTYADGTNATKVNGRWYLACEDSEAQR